jgi:hypothetical protein
VLVLNYNLWYDLNMKQYMVIETFFPECKGKIYERFHAKGRMLPEGLAYLNSWLEKDGDRCFQLMETNDPWLFQVWFENWKDLGSIEVIEIGEKPRESKDAQLGCSEPLSRSSVRRRPSGDPYPMKVDSTGTLLCTQRPFLSARFRDALAYAATVHSCQVKKGTTIPYVSHLLGVCAMVLEYGGDEDEAIAGLLHDSLEDHPEKVTREELRERFGARVARIVEGCTDTPPGYSGGPKPPWHQRKRHYIEHLRLEGSSFACVALADKLHNARAILADYRVLGDELWSRFNAGKTDQLWYFSELVGAFREAGAPVRMLEEFSEVVSELERLTRAA